MQSYGLYFLFAENSLEILIYLLYNGVNLKSEVLFFMQARFNHKIEAIAVSDIRQFDMEVSQIEGSLS